MHFSGLLVVDLTPVLAKLDTIEEKLDRMVAAKRGTPRSAGHRKRRVVMPNVHVSAMGVSSLLEPIYIDDSFIPARGQLFFEIDTREMKIGDGVTAWSSLNPVGGGSDPGGSTSSGPAAPTTGTWERGDVFWNSEPVAGGNAGWVCVAAGSPGVWAAFGEISV